MFLGHCVAAPPDAASGFEHDFGNWMDFPYHRHSRTQSLRSRAASFCMAEVEEQRARDLDRNRRGIKSVRGGPQANREKTEGRNTGALVGGKRGGAGLGPA